MKCNLSSRSVNDDTRVVRMATIATAVIPPLSALVTGTSFFAIAIPAALFGLMAALSNRVEGEMKGYLLALSIIGQCIVFTAAFAGHPWQLDTHMAFFAALAIVATLGSIPALLFAVTLTALHHLSFGILIPSLVYPSSDFLGNLERTVFHAAIVIFESGILLLSIMETKRQRKEIEMAQSELAESAAAAHAAKTRAEALSQKSRHAADQTRELGREAASAISEIASVAKTAAANAADSKNLVSRALVDAEKSGQIVKKTSQAMNAIRQSSEGITQIVELIDEIARRTDLLALNAAVESARAGDAGRGFAVVAKEVRKLAQQSADATLQIRTLVTTSGDRVKEGGELVVEAEHALKRIMLAVAELDGRMQEISSGATEQSSGLQQMAVAIKRIDDLRSDDIETTHPQFRLAS